MAEDPKETDPQGDASAAVATVSIAPDDVIEDVDEDVAPAPAETADAATPEAPAESPADAAVESPPEAPAESPADAAVESTEEHTAIAEAPRDLPTEEAPAEAAPPDEDAEQPAAPEEVAPEEVAEDPAEALPTPSEPTMVVDAARKRRPDGPTMPGASKLPPATSAVLEAIASAVERLRAEVDASDDPARRARLLNEVGEIQERGGDEPGAARDYLAAYNADTSFREPLEGLVRVLERRRSIENLGKLVETLVSAAQSPEERARALTERAIFCEDAQKDLQGARGAAREATETGAAPTDLGPAWLTLELVAAKLGDAGQREEALAGRAELPGDAAWRGLCFVSAADLAAKAGEVNRAIALANKARACGGIAAWAATETIERVVRAEPGLAGSEDARRRARAAAEALEARAEMLREAMEGARGEADPSLVPKYARSIDRLVNLLLRTAELRKNSNELARATMAVDRALQVVDHARAQDDDVETRDKAKALEPLVAVARLRFAELVGDTALSAELAERRRPDVTDGPTAAALAMRVAEHAASEGSVDKALEALTEATRRDPTCAPARALQIDILEGSAGGARFAAELEELSRQYASGDAQGRALLLASWIWASRAGDTARAREALGQAAACGVPKLIVARFGRSLASLRNDDAWYEDATRALVDEIAASKTDEVELPLLLVELLHLRLVAGDETGAAKAMADLRAIPGGLWLGRVLEGLASTEEGEDAQKQSRTSLEELTADVADPKLGRSLRVACALRAHAAGDDTRTFEHLKALAQEEPGDPLVAAFLGDLLRAAGERAAAARIAHAAAEANEDNPAFAAARFIEAGLEVYRLGDRAAGLAAFEASASLAPEAGEKLVLWASRAVDVDGLEGRRRALERAGGDGTIALERFALEATMGNPAAAEAALGSLDIAARPSLRLASALARLAWPKGASDHDGVATALDTLAETNTTARTAAAAERLRLAREESMGLEAVTASARAWLEEGGGAAAAVEWLAAAMGTSDAAEELPARRALAGILSDESREALSASTTLLEWVLDARENQALVTGSSNAARLANLELAPPGCEPSRRAAVLSDLDAALGEASEIDAMGLAAWSGIAAGDTTTALEVFRAVSDARPEDLHAWEGLRTAAAAEQDAEAYAVACEQLGARVVSDPRGAAFWEQAALTWLKIGGELESRGEDALAASFTRDATRPVAFDRLFRRVRERKDGDRLLELIARRLEVTEDSQEIAKLYWEQARVLREKGDPEGALEALEHVEMIDENHVGALALTGEIFIRRGMFAEAAEKLSRLARVDDAPPKNRVTAGVAAVDLYENKLGRHDLGLQVLLGLHEAKLTTLPVRERLARSAARTGSWRDATSILEELMEERAESDGRIEAARLAMAIHRDRLQMPSAAFTAAQKLLSEAPGDAEALDLVVGLSPELPTRKPLLERGRDALLLALHETPGDVDSQRRLARISHALGDTTLQQSALSCAVALGGPDGASEQMIALLSSKKPRVPEVAMTEPMLRQVLAPGDDGPLAALFAALGPTLGEALGPTRDSLGVGKRDRVDPKTGLALRNEIAAWAGAFGIANFDLYVGGKDPGAVQGVAGDVPAIVVGSGVNSPLAPATRARVARELFAIVRGTTVTRWRDDTTIAAIAVAACNITKVRVDAPPFPVLAEVERHIAKAISRKTKGLVEPLCRKWAERGQDPRQWASFARTSLGRVAVLASGDVGVVLADVFGEPIERLGGVARDDLRAHELLRFILSRPYFNLRRAMGLEGGR